MKSLLQILIFLLSSTKSIEGFYCAQVFFGMTSKTLYVAGMKTESEFPDVYLDFIMLRQHGIPSALRRDNAKSEMSQRVRVRQIHRDLVISDQWTEPHSPWQNSEELNGIYVKYLKSHAQHTHMLKYYSIEPVHQIPCGFWHKII
jgi:hypothetical protein